MKRAVALLRGLGGVGAFALVAACNAVLGIDADYQAVIEKFCQCEGYDQFWLKEIEASGNIVTFTCSEYLSSAFESDPEGARAWVDEFEASGCDKCKNALACATAAPLCLEDGENQCSAPETCCGFDRDKPYEHYCGFVVNTANELSTRCFTDEATCVGPLEPCETDADCCGSAGLTASCIAVDLDRKVCLTTCNPADDFRCPGCCASVTIGGEAGNVCLSDEVLGGLPKPRTCAALCAESSDCQPNEDCTTSVAGPVSIKLCEPIQ